MRPVINSPMKGFIDCSLQTQWKKIFKANISIFWIFKGLRHRNKQNYELTYQDLGFISWIKVIFNREQGLVFLMIIYDFGRSLDSLIRGVYSLSLTPYTQCDLNPHFLGFTERTHSCLITHHCMYKVYLLLCYSFEFYRRGREQDSLLRKLKLVDKKDQDHI